MISSPRHASERWRTFAVGMRVVVRRRRDDAPRPDEPQLTDVIGHVSAIDAHGLTLSTATGSTSIPASDIVAARQLPPSPRR